MTPLSILLTSMIIGMVIAWIFEFILKSNPEWKKKYYGRHKYIMGFHIHHSTYGLIMLIVSTTSLFLGENTWAMTTLGIGLGIIIMHTISEGRFIFIEKE